MKDKYIRIFIGWLLINQIVQGIAIAVLLFC